MVPVAVLVGVALVEEVGLAVKLGTAEGLGVSVDVAPYIGTAAAAKKTNKRRARCRNCE